MYCGKRNYPIVKVAFSSFFLCFLYSSYLTMKAFDKCCIIVARKVILFFVDDKKVSFCFVISIIDVYGT